MKNYYFIICVFFFFSTLFSSFSQESKSDIFDIARSGTLMELKELLSKNPKSIDEKNKSGYTPLILACYNENDVVAKYIIDNCNDVNLNSGYGTALMAATIKKNEYLVDYLLKKKADVNISDANGTTALHYAIIFNLNSIAEKLIKAGAKYNLKDSRGNTAKDYAILKNKSELLILFKS